ncbi:pyridoxal phosphate-dependent aminotransferase [Nocardia sp. alder85J]|uniref:pyridoxal phosphate-dependent aminotransferase n=1 Tax=Nocardia sp. alder85J TaxID=2862949 RepID=UPI001CD69A50|nr:aminotransferase class I/II-fold pyridoxal phosphate-dependent enzyme [Nocardia sp. alder85J]MCX4098758.1 aminotransferase class I/II-fold pyridoxal phosphate-dependent enzyme [Nocardia sp. alder85J]
MRYPLALNENPYGPLPSVYRALAQALNSANRYPEFLPHRLPQLIAARIGCAPEQIVVGAGATGVILHILQAFLHRAGPRGSGVARVVLAGPTFDGYPLLTETVGGRPVTVPLTPDGMQDLDAMAAAVDEQTRVVVLCNPHNPTGTRLRNSELTAFLERIDSRIAVILDEAYIEFTPSDQRIDTAALLAAHSNVVVVRTFSKAFGLAGLRVGYALAAPETAARIARWQVPYGMNMLAEIAVEACYAAEDELTARIQAITDERDRLSVALRQLGYEVPDSSANHLFLPLPDIGAARRITCAFEHAEIGVKRYATGMRITVGDSVANDAVITSLGRLAG